MLEARRLTYKIKSKTLIDDVSIRINCGEVLAIIGANGAGKSTLRKLLTGELKPTSGEVLMNDKHLSKISIAERARIRAVLPQDSTLNFPFTALEVVLLGRAPHRKNTETRRDAEIAREMLETVDAADLATRNYQTLSGGERQRVQFARVLAQIFECDSTGNKFLLLDEPTSNLDLKHQHRTLKIAKAQARQGVGVFVVLHDLNLAAQYADKIVMMKSGAIIANGSPHRVLTPRNIFETFGIEASVMKHPNADTPLIVPFALDDV